MSSDRPIVYWTCDDDPETLSCESIADAVYDWWHDIAGELEGMPDTVEVRGYARCQISEREVDRMAAHYAENLLEELDDEWGGEYRDRTKVTPEILAAAKQFVQAVVGGYQVWACEPVEIRTVRPLDYLEDDR